jgi:hypothetical protein
MSEQRNDIPGYEHPTETNTSRENVYKTFTEGQKSKTFGRAKSGNQYANYGEAGAENCPQCQGAIAKTCQCIYNDKTCVEGHSWYTNRDGKITNGNPHKQ